MDIIHLKMQASALRAQGLHLYVDDEGYTRIGVPPASVEPSNRVSESIADRMDEDIAIAAWLGCDYFKLVRMRHDSPPEWFQALSRALLRMQERRAGELSDVEE
jgi:hypothetical protein